MEDNTMNKRLLWFITASLILLMSTSTLVSAKSASADQGYTPADKEFYLTEQEIAFIRPGLDLTIMSVVIPADRQTEVTFKVTDPAGLPLDINGIYTPGPISILWTLAYIPTGEEAYVAYTTRAATSPITGDTAIQASYERPSNSDYVSMGDGVYLFKFTTVLPEDYDMEATTTVGPQARRNLTEFGLDEYVDNPLYHFIPSGMGTPMPRDIVTTATCNGCHDPLSLHGGWRYEVGTCVLCHNPTQSIDPDTGNSVNMPYMVHKIHMGADLENGYTIIGYGGSVHDYSHVEFPADKRECEICHTGGTPTDDFPMVATPDTPPVCDGSGLSMTQISWGDVGSMQIRLDAEDGKLFGASNTSGSSKTGKWVKDGTTFFMVEAASGEVLQELEVTNTALGCANNPPGTFGGTPGVEHTAWMTNPTRVNCGSCHDDIDFAEGEGHIAQEDDSKCDRCHRAQGSEYGRSVTGAHMMDYRSAQLDGFYVEILGMEDTGPGQSPRVTFSMKTKFGAVDPADINRLRFSLNGPNADFTSYLQENVPDRMVQSGTNWTYRFEGTLPAAAMGSFSLGVEGRLNGSVDKGGDEPASVRDVMTQFIEPFPVTDTTAVSRREVVDDAKCESCHANLALHGGGRNDGGAYCQTCHQTTLTDVDERPAGGGIGGAPQSADFRYMIHKIHRGEDLVRGYTIYGHNGSFHDYNHVEYPGDLRNCDACHVNDSYNLPLSVGVQPVVTPQDFWTPMLPETASCLSCHDSNGAAAHADTNTTDIGEACSVCHGENATYSVEEVHAR